MKLKFINLKSEELRAFTLVEVAVVIGILIILIVISFPAFQLFQSGSDLGNSAEEIINTLRQAQSRTLASEGASQYGVFFSTSTNQYILFKGQSYNLRATSSDEIHNLPKSVEIYETDLWQGQEVIFERLTGYVSSTSPFGKVSLRSQKDAAEIKTVYIENSGAAGLTLSATSSAAGQLTDSRHIHFDYNREISTSTEKIVLTFTYDSSYQNQEIVIADNLLDNQIYWEGSVNVGGEMQKIKIHTHRLNSPDTQFCVHRDRRYNNKALSIFLSGDATGNLISYTADGQEFRGASLYLTIGEAGNPQRQ